MAVSRGYLQTPCKIQPTVFVVTRIVHSSPSLRSCATQKQSAKIGFNCGSLNFKALAIVGQIRACRRLRVPGRWISLFLFRRRSVYLLRAVKKLIAVTRLNLFPYRRIKLIRHWSLRRIDSTSIRGARNAKYVHAYFRSFGNKMNRRRTSCANNPDIAERLTRYSDTCDADFLLLQIFYRLPANRDTIW